MAATIVPTQPVPQAPPPKDFHRLIWQQAQYCWRRLPAGDKGFGQDDLLSEGLLVYSKFLRRFDPERGCQFITGLTWSLMNHYTTILRNAWRRPALFCLDEGRPDAVLLEDLAEDRREPSLRAVIGGRLEDGLYRRLSREAWRAAQVALDPPGEFVRYCQEHNNRRLDGLLFAWLGYNEATKRRVRREIRLAMSKGAMREGTDGGSRPKRKM